VVDEEAISKGVGGFFESLMNDPSLTDDQRVQAKDAYNIIVKNSLNVPWYDEDVAGWGKDDAMSFQGLKNGLTYIDAMNAIRKENHLNTLGINLEAMAIAILNSEHGGHSEISLTENWAGVGYGLDGAHGDYRGSADPNEWERTYQNNDDDKNWPYSGWYTAEKHVLEEELKQHPDLDYSDIYQVAGHYLNFIDPDLKSMGFGVGTSGGAGTNGGGAVWDGLLDDPTFSQEQFRGLVNNYINMVEGRGDVSKLVAPQKAYNDAVANQNKLKKAYDDAKHKVDEAQNKVNEAQRNIHKLQDVTALDSLKSELSSAKKQADEAQKNLDAANKQVTSTAEKLVEAKQKQAEAATKQALAQANTKEAQGKLAKLQAQLKQAQDELSNLAGIDPAVKQNLDDAAKALKEAQDAYRKAQLGITDAQAAGDKASQALAEKMAALKDAEAQLQKAEDALTKATEQAEGSKEAYDKLVQLKEEFDKATGWKPSTDEPATDAPSTDKPSTPTQPSEEKPSEEKPNTDKPSTPTQPSEEKPNTDKQSEEKPSTAEPAQPSEEKPSADEPSQPSEENPAQPTKSDEGKADADKPGNTGKDDSSATATQGIKPSDDKGSAKVTDNSKTDTKVDSKAGETDTKADSKDTQNAKELGKTGVSAVWAAIVSSVMALLGIGGVTVAKHRRND
jgi:hypothetical protein